MPSVGQPEPPIEDFDLFAPSGRKHKFRRPTRRDLLSKWVTIPILLVISLALWAVLLSPLWSHLL
ncbi:MAG: hypothetical protein GEU91_18355 [Rhizobiales bacterium]|nr:hypothetical protein [Hyphomicrobiales bacterium]